jgi:hypothetical protein
MFDTNIIWASLVWGGIGSGFFAYGWKQKASVSLYTGLTMVALSYFIGSALLMSLAETATLVLMYWLKKQGY